MGISGNHQSKDHRAAVERRGSRESRLSSGVVETTARLVCICFGVNSSEHCVENFDWLVTFAALGSVANDHAAFCPKAERQWEPYLNLKLSGLFIDYYSRNQHTDSERLVGVYKAHVSAIGKRDSEEEC
ncbi:hypothetical protein Ddc_16056 [Ditylenchus destructor]|nr:hypothetical protein Ddc_16056 [Ditylenchus destructor]